MDTKQTPALLRSGEDLLGLDLFNEEAPVGPTVAEIIAEIPEDTPAERRAATLAKLRSDLAFEGVLLLPDDVSPLTETRMREFLALVGAGMTDKDAASAVGYSRWAAHRWKKLPGFADAYARAKHINVDKLIAEAKRRALHGSDRLLEFLLCNLAPEQFKRQPDVKVDVGVNLAERLAAGRKRTGADEQS